jgi:hypothetical protein
MLFNGMLFKILTSDHSRNFQCLMHIVKKIKKNSEKALRRPQNLGWIFPTPRVVLCNNHVWRLL